MHGLHTSAEKLATSWKGDGGGGGGTVGAGQGGSEMIRYKR